MKNILAMDLGKTTLGLAISRSGILVTPLTNIKFPAEDYDECIKLLLETIKFEKRFGYKAKLFYQLESRFL